MINPLARDESDEAPDSEFDDVLAMLLRAEEKGQRIDRDEWLQRYPHVADDLRAYLEDRDELNHVVRPLRQVLAPPGHAGPGVRVQYFGDYELLDEIGRGGMGVIYRARQVSLGRIVALKMVSGRLADAARFKAEAQAAASLDDPHIVPIYEIGEHDGCSYYSMKYVEGGSLRDRIDDGPIEPRRAAEIAAMIAHAVQVAHSHGILHRDLKPGNVLLDGDGNPLVSDFGLAKNVAAESELTQSGDVLGTPSYMSPEQASGGATRVTTATDVYGLGGVLYAMLTGKAPFRGDSPLETLDRVRHGTIDKPQSFSDLPRDLATICLKCLEREPSHRYASAQEVADDLGRFLRHEPILARPAGFAERAWRWARRNPAVASLLAVVVLSLVASSIGGTVLALKERAAREDADIAWREEATARGVADSALSEAVEARGKAEATLAEIFATYGLTAPSPERDGEKVLWFSAAARQAASDSAARSENALRVQSYARVTPLPVKAIKLRAGTITKMAFHPGGRQLLIGVAGDRQYLWDIDAAEPTRALDALPAVTHAEFTADGKFLVLAGKQGHVGVFSSGDGRCLAAWRHAGPVTALALSRDGSHLASAAKDVRVFDCRSLKFIGEPQTHVKSVTGLVWSKSGQMLAAGAEDGKLVVYSPFAANATPPIVADAPYERAYSVQQSAEFTPAFVLDDTAVLYPSKTATVACVAIPAGKTLWRKRVATNLYSLSVTPDGKFLFVGADRNGATLDIGRGGNRLTPHAHRHAIYGADHRGDSQMLATASWDRTAVVWSDVEPGPMAVLPHQAGVTCVKFSPDGELLATAQGDGVVKLWRVAKREPHVQRIDLESSATATRFSGDGRFVMATGTSFHGGRLNRLTAYETATGKQVGQSPRTDGVIVDAHFAPNAERVVAAVSFRKTRPGVTAVREDANDEGRIQVWNLVAGELLAESSRFSAEPRSIAISPDGTRIAGFFANGRVLVLNAADLKTTARMSTRKAAGSASQYLNNGVVRFTPDGKRVLLFGADHYIYGWYADTGRACFARLAHTSFVHDVDISGDSKTMVAASLGNDVRFWNLTNGKPLRKTLTLPDKAFRARFVDGGTTLLTACRDNLVRLQRVEDDELAAPPVQHEEEVFDARLTPNGRWIVSVALDRTLRISSRRTGQLVMPPIELGGGGWNVEMTPDGRYVAASGGSKSLTIVDLAELDEQRPFDEQYAVAIGELLSGHAIDRDRIASLTSGQWLERFHALTRTRPEMFALRPTHAQTPRIAWPRMPITIRASEEMRRRTSPIVATIATWAAAVRKDAVAVVNSFNVGQP
jgi:WD40 repeat protein